MQTPAQEAYIKIRAKLLKAPGMIEESERRLLFKLARSCGKNSIIEFGSFFGASSLALYEGMKQNNFNQSKLYCIDAFEVHEEHPLHQHVIDFAKKSGNLELLESHGGSTCWQNITRKTLGEAALERVHLEKCIINESFTGNFLPDEVSLLHLDLPKDAETIKPLLRAVFPRLAMNSIIAFQDYAYQFSNELIAFFELLEQKSIVEKYKMAASSIFYKVKSSRTKEINWEEILKTALLDEENLIRTAETKYSKITSARIQEKIKMKGALIRSMACKNKAYAFSNRTKLRTEIEKIMHMNSTLGGFVLAEIMTQEIEPHK